MKNDENNKEKNFLIETIKMKDLRSLNKKLPGSNYYGEVYERNRSKSVKEKNEDKFNKKGREK